MKSLAQLEELVLQGDCSLSRYCADVAKMFCVRPHEVAVMELRHAMLHFVYPPELRKTGLIPLISSAQAAKTATSRRAEIFNNFSNVRHSSVFETIRVSGENGQAIQRLMSAAVVNPQGEVMGVVQISRKGATPMEAGSEFEASDLQMLRDVTASLGRVAKELFAPQIEKPKVEVPAGQVLTK